MKRVGTGPRALPPPCPAPGTAPPGTPCGPLVRAGAEPPPQWGAEPAGAAGGTGPTGG